MIKLILLFFILILGCSRNSNLSGVTETGNTEISGVLVNPEGIKLAGVEVQLTTQKYPWAPELDTILLDTTDENGMYSIIVNDTGDFNLYAIDSENHYQGLITDLYISQDTSIDISIVLSLPGVLVVDISSISPKMGDTLIFEGTSIVSVVSKNSVRTGIHPIPNLPAGKLTNLVYKPMGGQPITLIKKDSLIIISSDSTFISTSEIWNYKNDYVINLEFDTSRSTDPLIDFPYTIELNSSHINFEEFQNKNDAVQFMDKNGNLIPFEIENWDPVIKQATIWLLIDTLIPGENVTVNIFSGLEGFNNQSNSQKVFKLQNGYVGVWHFSGIESESNPLVIDATENNFHGNFINFSTPTYMQGKIGQGLYFDGIDDHVVVKDEPKLNFGTGDFTLSAVVSLDTISLDNQIACKRVNRQGNYEFQINGEGQGKFGVYFEEGSQDLDSLEGSSEIITNTWYYLTVVRSNGVLSLYQNGELETQKASLQNVNSISDLYFGMDSDFKTEFYKGIMDEIRFSNVARTPEWIYYTYKNAFP